ncbi:hypothetical protein AN958_10033 [Leucoagaricus sp. SymC.cos]|nr:hypothetical protein AN958_10033 [Leucoagaricus sp. SymC.cos]
MCDAWREEIDKLLIFAGLFSATITAFTAESYKWLQPNSEDLSSTYLYFLASEYAKSHNTTLPLLPSPFNPQESITVSATSIRINTFWFLSLTLSLTTVLTGILCLQWLREFRRSSSAGPLPPKSSLGLRQMRFEGLFAWRVPEILSALPLLLQLSLLLFFAGLLDLLWDRNPIVAGVISGVVGLVVCFMGVTTVIPGAQLFFTKDEKLGVFQCPYKSPQSWLFLRITQLLVRLFIQTIPESWSRMVSEWSAVHRVLKSIQDLNWSELDMRWRSHRDATIVSWGTPKDLTDSSDIIHSLSWVHKTFSSSSPSSILPLYHSLSSLSIPAASQLISSLYQNTLLAFEDTTFRIMMDNRFSPALVQKRETIATFYLHLLEGQHGGVIKPLYIESVVRILNSQDVPVPFLDWMSTILQEIVEVLRGGAGGGATTGKTAPGIADISILIQVVACAGSSAATNSRRNIDIVNTWIILDFLLWDAPSTNTASAQTTTTALLTNHYDSAVTKSLATMNTEYLSLAASLFQNLKAWVFSTTREIDRRNRVEVCMEGLLLIFPDTLTEEELRAFSSSGFHEIRREFIEGAKELVKALVEVGDKVGAVPGIMKNTAPVMTRKDCQPPLPYSSPRHPQSHRHELERLTTVGHNQYDVEHGDATGSLENWRKLAGKFWALSQDPDDGCKSESAG